MEKKEREEAEKKRKQKEAKEVCTMDWYPATALTTYIINTMEPFFKFKHQEIFTTMPC